MSDLKNILFLLFILILFSSVRGQEIADSSKNDGWFNYMQVSYLHGHHTDFEGYRQLLEGDFHGVGFRLGKQSTGRQAWQVVHAYPKYGIGFSIYDLGTDNVDELFGKPVSYYLFYSEPILSVSEKFRLNADLEIGLATAFHKYDPDKNPEQNIIAAKTNLHANMSLELYYLLTERIDVAMGISFLHFSCGRMATPQKGINMLGFNLSSTYHYNSPRYKQFAEKPYRRPALIKREKPEFKPYSEISIMAAIGNVQAEPGDWKHKNGDMDSTQNVGPRYFTNSVTVDYAYQFNHKLKMMGGVDFFYDRSVENYYGTTSPDALNFNDKAFYGAHAGLQYVVGKIALMFNYGRYIYKPFEERGKWYMRAGGRFEILPKLDAQISLKTRDERVADWIEWGLVYKMRWN
ncbi:acyloxyacyl hydrolase [Maribellus sediminis]|uniref:acyloxyacyl hydrolase n=1 Tax=Maribellus sediminis TaxID=2696285 RepID=UPI0014305672|nr:acyloxyacyl hydrolase [Maribellus sediminis]